MEKNVKRDYFYFRSGFIHRIRRIDIDEAIELSDEEIEELKDEMSNGNLEKFKILKEFWIFLTENENRTPFDFQKFFDAKCAEKRRIYGAMERNGQKPKYERKTYTQ